MEGSENVKQETAAMDKFLVKLTDEERGELEGLISKGRHAARKLIHARALLLADTCQGDRNDEDIADALLVSTRTVARVRKRFVTEGFAAALDHRPQPRRPGKIKIKGDIEQELVRIACGDPPEGRCHWTLQLLADELVALRLVEKVSHETVRQALQKTTSSRGWSKPGACRPTPTATSCGEWRT
jgi:hypothetical protein